MLRRGYAGKPCKCPGGHENVPDWHLAVDKKGCFAYSDNVIRFSTIKNAWNGKSML